MQKTAKLERAEKAASSQGIYSKSQVKIILAAEKLFAQFSLDGVSLREIAVAADQRNHYAVQYHFGSREGLIRAVFSHRMIEMEGQRGAMLAAAERDGLLGDARALIEMVFLPQLSLQGADSIHSYANFLCQFLLRQNTREFGDFGVPLPPNLSQVMALLRVRLAYLPTAAAQRRLIGVCFVFLNILVAYGENGEDRERDESFAAALEDTLAQIETALCLPLAGTPAVNPRA